VIAAAGAGAGARIREERVAFFTSQELGRRGKKEKEKKGKKKTLTPLFLGESLASWFFLSFFSHSSTPAPQHPRQKITGFPTGYKLDKSSEKI